MKKLFFALLAVGVVLLAACTTIDEDAPVVEKRCHKTSRITPEDACSRAVYYLKNLKDRDTRGVAEVNVKSIDVIGANPSVRSGGETDTLLYVVNFDEGFAIMGADRRMLPVYAISDEGSISESDFERDGMGIIMQGIRMDALVSLDSSIIIGDLPPAPELYNPYRVRIAPKLHNVQSCLGYGLPYCKYCRNSKGEVARSGCAAAAVEQIMSFHKWPKSYGGYTFDWNHMSDNDYDVIARVLQQIGLPQNLNMNYVHIDTIAGGSPSNMPRTFENMGYSVNSRFLPFIKNQATVRYVLINEPILMVAYSTKVDEQGHKFGGHAWVIDGMLQYYSDQFVHDPSNLVKTLYHCAWGWEGDCNGYYYIADQNAFIGAPDEYDRRDNGTSNASYYVHQNVLIEFMFGMRPIK